MLKKKKYANGKKKNQVTKEILSLKKRRGNNILKSVKCMRLVLIINVFTEINACPHHFSYYIFSVVNFESFIILIITNLFF